MVNCVLNIDCYKYGYQNQKCADYIASYIKAYSGDFSLNSAQSAFPDLPEWGYNNKVIPPPLKSWNQPYYPNPNNLTLKLYSPIFTDEIDIQYQINSIEGVDQIQGTIKMDIMISMKWTDPRLAVNSSLVDSFQYCFTPFYLHAPSAILATLSKDWVWYPTLSLLNSNGEFLSDFSWGDVAYFDLNGKLWLRGSGSVTANCDLDLQLFPYDTQICEFRFGSYTQNIFNGYNFSVDIDATTNASNPRYIPLTGPKFVAPTSWKFITAKLKWAQEIVNGPINFFTLQYNNNSLNIIEIKLTRYSTYYTTTGVLPLTVLVILSIFALFIPKLDARVGVLATIVLATVAIGVSGVINCYNCLM